MLLTELCIDEREEGSLHFAPSLNQYPVHATLANLYTLFSFFFFLFVFLIKFLKKKKHGLRSCTKFSLDALSIDSRLIVFRETMFTVSSTPFF